MFLQKSKNKRLRKNQFTNFEKGSMIDRQKAKQHFENAAHRGGELGGKVWETIYGGDRGNEEKVEENREKIEKVREFYEGGMRDEMFVKWNDGGKEVEL